MNASALPQIYNQAEKDSMTGEQKPTEIPRGDGVYLGTGASL